jgi:hypothetical protein
VGYRQHRLDQRDDRWRDRIGATVDIKTEDIGTVPSPNGQAPPHLRRLKDKVAIVGFADGHRHLAPFDDPAFEIWGLNRLHASLPGKRFDRWFELHNLDMYADDQEHQAFLRSFPGEVYVRPEDIGKLDIPAAVPFPKTEMLEAFLPYFTNTVSWLLGLSLMMEHSTVGVWGVDMAQDTLLQAEYQVQRPSCEYFLGVCAGRGVEVILPEGSDLLRATHLYGFEEPAMVTKHLARLKELDGRKQTVKQQVAQLDSQKAAAVSAVQQLDGAMQEIQYQLRNFTPNPDRKD